LIHMIARFAFVSRLNTVPASAYVAREVICTKAVLYQAVGMSQLLWSRIFSSSVPRTWRMCVPVNTWPHREKKVREKVQLTNPRSRERICQSKWRKNGREAMSHYRHKTIKPITWIGTTTIKAFQVCKCFYIIILSKKDRRINQHHHGH